MTVPNLANLPGPVKGGLVLATGGGLIAAAWAMGLSPAFLLFLAGGAVVVVAIVLGYKRLLALAKRGKGNTLLGRMFSGGAPVTSPELKAQLDDLRKKFEAGLEVFKTHGKSPLDVPWYLLVGEPGSGKSYLIRKVGRSGQWFPSGLQDELQGIGGTINMHWWFMKPAVVIDTAGKMLMKEVRTGENSEWKEFLRLLRNARPECPINGMLLVIPADSLIRDRTEDIERKAGHIARQLELIQRTLDVRFPVFVVVTKCDLITGFRDFFEGLDDPQLQHQMLGWSNPAGLGELDAPFVPDDVDRHLESVCQRLARRRLGLLVDPVSARDPRARRIDEVDSLYALPESLMKIAPRLRRYLEIIFVAGEWSPKPLFLRGIYFTSSVQEGTELDQALAEALGVSVDTLLGGHDVDRERALFLLDLFRDKVFREKGLVTRASNVKKQQQRRRAIMLGAGVAATAILTVATVWSGWTLRRSIQAPGEFWQAVARQQADPLASGLALLERDGPGRWTYAGQRETRLPEHGPTPLAAVPVRTYEEARRSIRVPVVFRLLTVLSSDLQRSEREAAHAAVLAHGVIGPVVEAARIKMRDPDLEWDQRATDALAELLRIERDQYIREHAGAAGPPPSPIDLGRLYRFVLDEAEYQKFQAHERALTTATNWAFFDSDGAAEDWPAPRLAAGSAEAGQAILAGARKFLESDEGRGTGGVEWARLRSLRDSLAAFKAAEDRLLTIDDAYPKPADEPRSIPEAAEVREKWAADYKALMEALPALEHAVAALEAGAIGSPGAIASICDAAERDTLAKAQAACDRLLEPLAEPGALPDPTSPDAGVDPASAPAVVRAYAMLLERRGDLPRRVEQEARALRDALTGLEKDFLARARAGEPMQFERRATMYRRAEAELNPPAGLVPASAGAAEVLAMLDRAIGEADAAIGAAPPDTRLAQGAAAARFMLRLARRGRAHEVLAKALREAPATAADLARLVESRTGGSPSLWDRSRPPLSGAPQQYDTRFDPAAASAVLSDLAAIQRQLPGPGEAGAADVLEADELRGRARSLADVYEEYADDYLEYWSATVFEETEPAPFESWAAFREAMRAPDVSIANRALQRLGEDAAGALEKVEPLAGREPFIAAAREIRAAIKGLSPQFANEVQDICWRWEDLPAEVPAARRAILEMDAVRKFRREYIVPVDTENPGFVHRYWNRVLLGGLTVLAQTSYGQAGEALGRLRTVHKRFPLCRDVDLKNPMSPEEVLAAATDALLAGAGLAGPAPAEDGEAGSGGRIGWGARPRVPGFDEQLDMLVGRQLVSAGEEAWLRRLAAVATAMAGTEPLQTVQVWRAEYEVQQDPPPGAPSSIKPAGNRYLYVAINTSDGFKGGKSSAGGEAQPFHDDPMRTPGPALTIDFYVAEEDPAPAIAAVPVGDPAAGRWATLAAILRTPGARRDEKDPRDWYVPLTFNDAAGQAYWYWIKLRFNRELPEATQWPTAREWPR